MTQRLEATIACRLCKAQAGVVYAVEDPKRPGFWAHVSEPEYMPKVCPVCEATLVRFSMPDTETRNIKISVEGTICR